MVEDDEDVARLNARMLKRNGYDVLLALTASEARAFVRDNTPDLFVFDIELPDGDGLELCKEFRRGNDAPILFLTGRKELEDELAGLGAGGDYYLTKPYNIEKLLAVAETLLRRAEQTRNKLDKAVAGATTITRGILTLDLPKGKAYVNGNDTGLTQKEFSVLLLLVQNEDKELTDRQLYESLWNAPMNDDSSAVRKSVQRLRRKLGADNTDDFDILTLYGGGFSFTTK
jgi:DNA-binding response OmpR family regulator